MQQLAKLVKKAKLCQNSLNKIKWPVSSAVERFTHIEDAGGSNPSLATKERNMVKKIFKGSSYLIFFQAGAKIIIFFYTVFLASNLGVDNFGVYVTALAYYSLFSSFTDFGFNRFLIREGAKNPLGITSFISHIIFLRIFITILLFLGFSLWIFNFDPNHLRSTLSILAVFALIPHSISLTFDSVLIAKQRLLFSGIGWFILSLANALTGIFLIEKGYGIFGPIIALTVSQVIYLFVLAFFSRVKVFILSTSVNKIREIIRGSLPYGILGVLGLIYFRIDILLLSYLKGVEETGLYGAAYRFLEAIIFVPNAVSAALFPIMARLHEGEQTDLKKIYSQTTKIMLLAAIPIMGGFFFILPIFIKYFLPQYSLSISAIQILTLAIPFMFIQVPAINVLFSSEKYLKAVIFISFFAILFNVVLNLVFIPRYGFIGASWVTVASEILSFVVFFIFLRLVIFKSK